MLGHVNKSNKINGCNTLVSMLRLATWCISSNVIIESYKVYISHLTLANVEYYYLLYKTSELKFLQ